MFNANTISARSYLSRIRLYLLQSESKITLTPSRHQIIHSKTDTLHAVLYEYSRECLQPKIGRKNQNIQHRPEKQYS